MASVERMARLPFSAQPSREAAAMTDFSEQPETPGPQPRQGAKAASVFWREKMEFSSSSRFEVSLPVSACAVEAGMLSLEAASPLAEAEEPPEVDVQPASRPASRAAHTSRERIRLRVIEKTSFYRFPVEDRGNLWGTALVYCAAGRLSIGVCRTIFNLPCTNCTNFAPIFCLRAGLTIFALARIIQS